MAWSKPSFCLDFSYVFSLVSKENRAYSFTQPTHTCSPAFILPPLPSALPQGTLEPISGFQPHLKYPETLDDNCGPGGCVKIVKEERDTKAFPSWGGSGQSVPKAAGMCRTLREPQSSQAFGQSGACKVEEAGLSRWESTGGLRYKSVASQASLAWLRTLRKQLLFPKRSRCKEDVPLSLGKCHILEKCLHHWKMQGLCSQSWVHRDKERS